MTGPRGTPRTAARVSRDAKAIRNETGESEGNALASAEASAHAGTPAPGSAGAAEGNKGTGAFAQRPDHSVYGALDLGTNNCRLLVAKPSRHGFVVIDAFSRIIRLGEGVLTSGKLSDDAMQRTIDALRVCRDKMRRRAVTRSLTVLGVVSLGARRISSGKRSPAVSGRSTFASTPRVFIFPMKLASIGEMPPRPRGR